MYSCIAIIGLGTLGGFVTDSVSELETVEEIVIVDYDQVQEKNLRNSIYKWNDVGKLKTDALFDIIRSKNEDIKITKLNVRFIEEENVLPVCDLVLDCRDFVYDRKELVDVRLYISSRYMIVDCRKNVKYDKHFEGRYTSSLSKSDLRNAANMVLVLIENGVISSSIRDNNVSKFDLDYLKQMNQKTDDVAYDSVVGEEKLINLRENLLPILKMNKKSDLDVNMCIGEKNVSVKTIPRGALRSGEDVIVNLTSMLNLPVIFNNFVISTYEEENKSYVVLIPETGAA